ncbi:MAG TPA: hypothetical protein VNO55_29050, partial [Polyangia bacterium]|nr:hypothetical protein [Polyangia bacterium]
MIDIGTTLDGSIAFDINNQGVVVGCDTEGATAAINPGNIVAHGFTWTETGGRTPIPSDAKGVFPTGINDAGVISGSHVTSSGWITAGYYNPLLDSQFHSINGAGAGAGINAAGTMTGHGYYPGVHTMFRFGSAGNDVLPEPPGFSYTIGNAIDDSGAVVGHGDLSSGDFRALRYSDARGIEDLNTFTNVSTEGGPWTLEDARGTNGSIIVGWGVHDGNNRAFRLMVGPNGSNLVTDLGTIAPFLGDNYVNFPIAHDVNTRGEVVGSIYDHWGFYPYEAFVWVDGTGIVDLNTKIDPSSGWRLQAAYAINDNREVVGWGTVNGAPHGFKMTLPDLSPCPPTDGCHSPGIRQPNGTCLSGTAFNDGTACSTSGLCGQQPTCQTGSCTCPSPVDVCDDLSTCVFSQAPAGGAAPELHWHGGTMTNIIVDLVFWNLDVGERAIVQQRLQDVADLVNGTGPLKKANSDPAIRYYGLWGVIPGNTIVDTDPVSADLVDPKSGIALSRDNIVDEIRKARRGDFGPSLDASGNSVP